MASRYLPPHLRGRSNSHAENSSSTMEGGEEQSERLGRRRLADLKLSDNDSSPLHTLFEIKTHFGSSTTNATLHNSKDEPDRLAYVVLFRYANPRWSSDHIIFAHTNIHLLAGYASFKAELEASKSVNESATGTDDVKSDNDDTRQEDNEVKISASSNETTAPTSPSSMIPVFMEMGIAKGVTRRFGFHGFFTISNLQFLKPRSPELVRMLQQKWTPAHRNPNRPAPQPKQREQQAWEKSMDQEWSVIQMMPVPKETWPQEPEIADIPDEEQEDQGRAERKGKAFSKRSGQDSDNIEAKG